MKNPSPDTSSPVAADGAFGTTRTALGTPFTSNNDCPTGTPPTGTFPFTRFGIGSRFGNPLALGDALALGTGAGASLDATGAGAGAGGAGAGGTDHTA